MVRPRATPLLARASYRVDARPDAVGIGLPQYSHTLRQQLSGFTRSLVHAIAAKVCSRMIVIFEEIDGKVWAIVLDERGDEIARYLEKERAVPEFV